MRYERIPLTAGMSDQQVSVVLDNNPYLLRVVWNERFKYFSLSIAEISGEPIVTNIKMVAMYNLTFRFADDRMPLGDLFFMRENGPAERPDFEDLQTSAFLWYVTPVVI